jgi:anthranilate phosphoribosyltransferase
MKKQLEELLQGKRLSVDETRALMGEILAEGANPSHVAAILTVFRMRGVTLDELDGASHALLQSAHRVDLSPYEVIDVCGTGGDQKGCFNISTTVAFVLAGAGYRVAKHGNYGVSSACGSSNVLEALGITFTHDAAILRRGIEEAQLCFMHAPLFHPLMKRVQGVRRELGFRTIFNMLGPLVNPAEPAFQLTGVYDLELLRLYGYLLHRRGKRFAVVHALDGFDEVSLTGGVRVMTDLTTHELVPRDFGFDPVSSEEIRGGGSVEESAQIVTSILEGRAAEPYLAVTAANAGLAMWCRAGGGSLREHVERALESIRSGAALRALTMYRRVVRGEI